jgi:predicted ester cyclase
VIHAAGRGEHNGTAHIQKGKNMADLAALVEAARQCWNAGDLDGYLRLYDPRIQLHGYAPGPLDKTAVTEFYRGIFASLPASGRPGPQLDFHQVLVDGPLYCCSFTMSGVHTGEFMGVPATGRPYALDGITILRFEGDKVVERWSTADFLGMLTQLGVLPAMAG